MGASSRSLRPRTTRNNSDRGVEREASPEERVDQHPKQFTRTTAHHSSTATGKSLSQYTSNKANNPVANSQLRSTLTTHHVYTPAVSSKLFYLN